ncbi:MAG: prolyl oligopeptidase family serine peptidase, partial [Thermoguttaceae bacterium]|nr:prolyl oligopeptidase family serine peptidase [Thermoguttaceae bacterium]
VGENLDQSSQVQCVIDVCGTTFMPLAFVNYGIPEVVDTIEKIGGLTVDRTKPIWEQPEAMATCMKYSVVTYVDADYSPTLIVQGALDPAIMPSQSFLFYEMLKKYGVRTELKFVEEGEHNVFLKMTREEMETLFYGFLGW